MWEKSAMWEKKLYVPSEMEEEKVNDRKECKKERNRKEEILSIWIYLNAIIIFRSHFINPFLYTSDKIVSTFVCDDF